MTQVSANEYKFLCSQANAIMKMPKGTQVGDGWVKVESSPKSRSNFKAVLYQKGDQYAICFVGTDKFSAKDHGANVKMGITGENQQIQDARDYAEEIMQTYGLTPQNTVIIGHSEGGTEATYVGLENGFRTFTFNAYGVLKSKLPQYADFSLVTNFRDPHDPVSKMRENVGRTYITPSTQTGLMARTIFGSLQAHGIKNMGDCDKAVPIEQYKKEHTSFLNEIFDAEITREDIAQMDSSLFEVYEPEINNRMLNNEILSSAQLIANGVIYVKGYIRSDGTRVRGYYKRMKKEKVKNGGFSL